MDTCHYWTDCSCYGDNTMEKKEMTIYKLTFIKNIANGNLKKRMFTHIS